MKLRALVENKETLELVKLPYSETSLEPVMDSDTVKYHYGVLSKGYVDRFNSGEGDPGFNKAGALLHNYWWSQLCPPSSKQPSGKILELIEKNYNSYADFKDEFIRIALKIQGSGWCYLTTDGSIKTIQNHKWEKNILLLIDCWEHSFYLDYHADKKSYLRKIWQIINWDFINSQL